MIPNTQDLITLRDEILAADAETRYLFQPRLSELIERCHAASVAVPADIKTLHEELTEDAIEAQFDNMPV